VRVCWVSLSARHPNEIYSFWSPTLFLSVWLLLLLLGGSMFEKEASPLSLSLCLLWHGALKGIKIGDMGLLKIIYTHSVIPRLVF
jgi:hypothetical protein